MEGDQGRFHSEIERCISELRCDLEAVTASRAFDDGVLRELMQITDEIERHLGVDAEPLAKAVTD